MDQAAERGRTRASLPLEASLTLSDESSSIAQARRFATAFLTTAGSASETLVTTDTVQIVQLIVSELVTNARKYAPGPAVLHLRITDTVVQVELQDSNPVLPVPHAHDPQRVGQHGLEIVAALAGTVTTERLASGKRVGAEVALTAAPS
ncbi:ATP-binding protein [Streptomyces sp. NPDC005227]|uniref:ATP-binding protein n=1 Tax=Streptomyces sp. NPDC005227 TaxID=3364707 RepID=UPI0036C2C9E3